MVWRRRTGSERHTASDRVSYSVALSVLLQSIWTISLHDRVVVGGGNSIMLMLMTYRSGKLDGDFRHADKSPVKVLDSLCSIIGGLVADIANSSLRKKPRVCDGVFCKMFFEVGLIHCRRKTSHEYTRRRLSSSGHVYCLDACARCFVVVVMGQTQQGLKSPCYDGGYKKSIRGGTDKQRREAGKKVQTRVAREPSLHRFCTEAESLIQRCLYGRSI